MIIIYGHRWYGRAFPRGGQGVATRLFHVYYVPLIPLGQMMWVTQSGDGAVRGIPTRWNWRAALPLFVVQWGLIATIASAGSPPLALAFLVGTIAATVWGYRGSHPTGPREEARRALTHEVLGTGCPVELMKGDVLRKLAPGLDAGWGQLSADRSPDDVAELGPRDRREAAHAYTLLVVRAHCEGGALRKTLRARADRVLDALSRTPSLPQGAPYRAEVLLPESTEASGARR